MNKYTDNKLAEELDWIVLKNNRYKEEGFPSGTIGQLTYSYTGMRRPMYGIFEKNGKKQELFLRLNDYRVLNAFNKHDFSMLCSKICR